MEKCLTVNYLAKYIIARDHEKTNEQKHHPIGGHFYFVQCVNEFLYLNLKSIRLWIVDEYGKKSLIWKLKTHTQKSSLKWLKENFLSRGLFSLLFSVRQSISLLLILFNFYFYLNSMSTNHRHQWKKTILIKYFFNFFSTI